MQKLKQRLQTSMIQYDCIIKRVFLGDYVSENDHG